jgi:hypothetical protein
MEKAVEALEGLVSQSYLIQAQGAVRKNGAGGTVISPTEY